MHYFLPFYTKGCYYTCCAVPGLLIFHMIMCLEVLSTPTHRAHPLSPRSRTAVRGVGAVWAYHDLPVRSLWRRLGGRPVFCIWDLNMCHFPRV